MHLRRNDGESAQNGGAFPEPKEADNQPVQGPPAREMLGDRREDDMEPKSASQTVGHGAMEAAVRRLLNSEDVRIESSELPDRNVQPLFQTRIAIEKSGARPIMEKVVVRIRNGRRSSFRWSDASVIEGQTRRPVRNHMQKRLQAVMLRP